MLYDGKEVGHWHYSPSIIAPHSPGLSPHLIPLGIFSYFPQKSPGLWAGHLSTWICTQEAWVMMFHFTLIPRPNLEIHRNRFKWHSSSHVCHIHWWKRSRSLKTAGAFQNPVVMYVFVIQLKQATIPRGCWGKGRGTILFFSIMLVIMWKYLGLQRYNRGRYAICTERI
jgi:hypothetical protein